VRRSTIAAVAYPFLIGAFWLVARQFGLLDKLGAAAPAGAVSFALLLAPYWAFGFGAADILRKVLHSPAARVLAPALLATPYAAFVAMRGGFDLSLFLALAGFPVAIAALLQSAPDDPPNWRDAVVLAALALAVELHVFDRAWPLPSLGAFAKLLCVDAALYAYLVIRPIRDIGFDFRPIAPDFAIGLREFLYFTPIALAIGFALGFIHWHGPAFNPLQFAAGWLFTLFFIAIPEEIFFRGLLLNFLEPRLGTRRALYLSSALFGIAHFNKRANVFNWRYVILAAIAGVFYGRAWLARRRVLTSSVTHATVDTVWSVWLR
jgi:membrane protease YdiL (CAAX protease family)